MYSSKVLGWNRKQEQRHLEGCWGLKSKHCKPAAGSTFQASKRVKKADKTMNFNGLWCALCSVISVCVWTGQCNGTYFSVQSFSQQWQSVFPTAVHWDHAQCFLWSKCTKKVHVLNDSGVDMFKTEVSTGAAVFKWTCKVCNSFQTTSYFTVSAQTSTTFECTQGAELF